MDCLAFLLLMSYCLIRAAWDMYQEGPDRPRKFVNAFNYEYDEVLDQWKRAGR